LVHRWSHFLASSISQFFSLHRVALQRAQPRQFDCIYWSNVPLFISDQWFRLLDSSLASSSLSSAFSIFDDSLAFAHVLQAIYELPISNEWSHMLRYHCSSFSLSQKLGSSSDQLTLCVWILPCFAHEMTVRPQVLQLFRGRWYGEIVCWHYCIAVVLLWLPTTQCSCELDGSCWNSSIKAGISESQYPDTAAHQVQLLGTWQKRQWLGFTMVGGPGEWLPVVWRGWFHCEKCENMKTKCDVRFRDDHKYFSGRKDNWVNLKQL
jgi:hypothetical protein